MPPVEHEHHQYVPDLMAGAQVVQLTWKITLWNFGHVEDDSSYSKYIHYQHSGNKFLDYVRAETPTEPDPMKGGDEAISRHSTEYNRAKLLPLLGQVMRVYLGEEHCQHHGQNGYQVHLPPVVIAVERIEHSWNITAYDSYGDPSIIQCHPAAAGFFRTVAAKQVIAHRTQHAHLEAEEAYGVYDIVLSGRS